jgi:ATPase subunit of ABC transporter with duplicated ATPase domains
VDRHGPKRAGKTTLLRMIASAAQPDRGTVRLGASLVMGYFAQQSLDMLDGNLTVTDQLQKDFPQDSPGSLRILAGAFQFSGEQVDKPVRLRTSMRKQAGKTFLLPARLTLT